MNFYGPDLDHAYIVFSAPSILNFTIFKIPVQTIA